MPGTPQPNGAIKQFRVAPQCVCGAVMHLGEDVEDICKRGEMTCQNASCKEFGKVYRAPTMTAQYLYDFNFAGRT